MKIHPKVDAWIDSIRKLTLPSRVHFCDGTRAEFDRLISEMKANGVATALVRPRSFLFRSAPDDVARIEGSTYICCRNKEDAGPTNNWKDPAAMRRKLEALFKGSMSGRTMYVVIYMMGPPGSPLSKIGIELTDSPYVVVNMHLMTRMGQEAVSHLAKDGEFIPGIHSVGKPLLEGKKDVPWPCSKEKYVVHFPESREIWSYGSGYGGNALLGKKCFALRIASTMARDEGWMAEHMLILSITSPEGKTKHIAAAFPSACGKTNLAMLRSSRPGWAIRCVGDDIAWMKFSEKDGRLYAINPENGYFGVAPGTSERSNYNAMQTIGKNTLFTNVALTEDGDVWWEGMSAPPGTLTDWKGNPWTPASPDPAAHPNSRFTVSMRQNPAFDPDADNPHGVPIDAIIFGGRRRDVMPLVLEAKDWTHGVLLGAALSSETTAASEGDVGKLRHDPFAMLPFCGYHMGDYFRHWLSQQQKGRRMPKIFHVNWFRKDAAGQFIWPGFGENMRVLEWIFRRTDGDGSARATRFGLLPTSIDLEGLLLSPDNPIFSLDEEAFTAQIEEWKRYFVQFGDKMPQELLDII